jgi:hypothetical protein
MIAKLIAAALVALVAAPLFSYHQLTTGGASALVSIAGDGLGAVAAGGLFCELLL